MQVLSSLLPQSADRPFRPMRAPLLAYLLLALALAPAKAPAEGVGMTGVEKLLKPIAIFVAPFVIVGNLLGMPDSKARALAEKKAEPILAKLTSPILLNGLYTGSVPVKFAVQGILTEGRVPFIEMDAAAAEWVFENADIQAYLARGGAEPFLRVSLGDRGDPDCFLWKSSYYDWTLAPPIRPGTCLKVRFVKELESDIRLNFNARNVEKKELWWELSERVSGKQILSIPFWQSQMEGQPLFVGANYLATDTNAFAQMIRKLSPSSELKNSEGRPFVLRWKKNNMSLVRWASRGATISATVTKVDCDVEDCNRPRKQGKGWEGTYADAYSEGKPRLLGSNLIIIPQEDMLRQVEGVNDFGLQGVFENSYISMTDEESGYKNGGPNPGPRPIRIVIHAESFEGASMWEFELTPNEIPAEHSNCADAQAVCSFYPEMFELTEQALRIRGRFIKIEAGNYRRGSVYDWAVPRSSLPPLAVKPVAS